MVALARFVGNVMGHTMEVADFDRKMPWGYSLHVRIFLDIDHPLLHGLRITFTGNESPMVTVFRYERLFELCYTCGVIHHTELNYNTPRVAA